MWAKVQKFDYYRGSAELGYEGEGALTREQVTQKLEWSDLDDIVAGPIFDRLGSDGIYESPDWSYTTAQGLSEMRSKRTNSPRTMGSVTVGQTSAWMRSLLDHFA